MLSYKAFCSELMYLCYKLLFSYYYKTGINDPDFQKWVYRPVECKMTITMNLIKIEWEQTICAYDVLHVI